jgi:hypothetical protein
MTSINHYSIARTGARANMAMKQAVASGARSFLPNRWAEMIPFRSRRVSFFVIVLSLAVSIRAHAGAWGNDSFENDDALDWTATCKTSWSISLVRDAFSHAISAKYLEAPDGSVVVAAAEVVAAAKRRPHPKLPAELAAWVKHQGMGKLSRLAPLALKALKRVRDQKVSELRQLWDGGDPSGWLACISDLELRLR